MDAERWQRMFDLFDRVAGLDPAERASVLEQACGEDGGLRGLAGVLAERGEHSEARVR